MSLDSLHATLLALARTLASQVLAAAARSSPNELADVRLRRVGRRIGVARAPAATPQIAPEEHVEEMVRLIGAVPGGVRARELRAMMRLGKRPFLRVADAALATKRIRREGFKAGIRYLLP